jgi:hypothetical protein
MLNVAVVLTADEIEKKEYPILEKLSTINYPL